MTVKELREKRKTAHEAAKRWHEERTKDGKALTNEDRAKWTEMCSEIDGPMFKAVEDAERIERLDGEMRATPPVVPGREGQPGDGAEKPETRKHDPMDDQAAGVVAWLKSTSRGHIEVSDEERAAAGRAKIPLGRDEIELRLGRTTDLRSARFGRFSGVERRDQSDVTPTTGGYLRPEGFVPRIERALLMFGGVRQVAEIIRTDTGNPLPWPTSDDTSNKGAAIGESTAAGTTDVNFGAFVMWAYKYSSKFIKVPRELLEDAGVDVAGYVADRLGERLARIQNSECTTGVGAGKPKGLTLASVSAFTSGAATAITPDELKRLEHAVDAAYRQMAGTGFMMSDGILGYTRTLKDGSGRYLFDVERVMGGLGGNVGQYNAGSVGYLLDGYPVYVNNDMAGLSSNLPTTATISVEFGDLSAYKIREVRGVTLLRLKERFADADQEGFIAFLRFDAGLLNAGTNPVKHILQA